jgi:hypothetical protein
MRLPKWRKMTWVILIVNLLFLIWVISGIAGGGDAGADCVREAQNNEFLTKADCEAAAGAGTAIGVGIVIFLWALVDVILGVVWLVTNRKKTHECPVCGSDVKKGATVCPSCGHDFRGAAAGSPSTV